MTRAEVVAYLRGLSVEEVRGVLRDIEDAWGSSIIVHEPCQGCHRIVYGPHACPGPARTETEQYEFEVVLMDVNATTRLPVLQALRASTSRTVLEARAMLERLPVRVQAGLSKLDADGLARRLRDAGAIVEIR